MCRAICLPLQGNRGGAVLNSNIVISGVGGQGVVTLGLLISRAAISQGEKVIMSEIHGLAQRGGSVSVDVRIGHYHAAMIPSGHLDLLIGLEPIETQRTLHRAGSETRILMSTEKIVPISLSMKHQTYPDVDGIRDSIAEKFIVRTVDAIAAAKEAGDYRSANVVLLGFLSGARWLALAKESLMASLSETFSGKALEINEKAFHLGEELAKEGEITQEQHS